MPRRIDMTATLREGFSTTPNGARHPVPEDAEGLAQLLLDAYAGTIDAEEETFDEALAEIGRTTSGEYGPYMPEHSLVVQRDGRIVAATLVTGWQGRPFIAYSMTAPDYQRCGLARHSIVNVMASLHHAGHEKLSLVVTLANTHAHSLYESLGFVPGR
jgi:ribosomal protein S18 acetylase RimI-like enzyme